jgi:ABC-type uncharacterized transport system substrate-binding protein
MKINEIIGAKGGDLIPDRQNKGIMRIFLLLLFPVAFLFAHPHCFINVYPVVGEKKLTITWDMDEMSSQIMLMDFDRDHNGQFSKNESRALFNTSFNSLHKYDYYTRFFRGKTPLPTGRASDFRASVKGFRVQYHFSLPLQEGVTMVRFCDEENFTAFLLDEASVRKANLGKHYKIRTYEGEIGYGYILELK